MGSHSTLYALIVPHISECWPEDGLIIPKHVTTVNTNTNTLLCFDGNIKTFCSTFKTQVSEYNDSSNFRIRNYENAR